MNKFINKILREAEDTSDDFFQSKHINKRKEDIKRELDKKKKEALFKLTKGLEEIKTVCNNKDWRNDKEKLFLELFSNLHVDKIFLRNKYAYGYYLSDSNDINRCFYNLKTDYFLIDYDSIWKIFKIQFNMSFYDIHSLMNKLLKEHFKLYDTIAMKAYSPYYDLLEERFKLYK